MSIFIVSVDLADVEQHGIITADDAGHSRQRKILSHSFSDKALKEQEPLLKKWAALMIKKLTERADGKQPLDLVKWYNCTTFDVMGNTNLIIPRIFHPSLTTPTQAT